MPLLILFLLVLALFFFLPSKRFFVGKKELRCLVTHWYPTAWDVNSNCGRLASLKSKNQSTMNRKKGWTFFRRPRKKQYQGLKHCHWAIARTEEVYWFSVKCNQYLPCNNQGKKTEKKQTFFLDFFHQTREAGCLRAGGKKKGRTQSKIYFLLSVVLFSFPPKCATLTQFTPKTE